MMKQLATWLALATMVLILSANAGAAGAATLATKLAPVPPFPAVCAAAQSAGIPLTGFVPPPPGADWQPGDAVTGLITLHEKKRGVTQWLVRFEAITNLPAKSAKPPQPLVLYTSTGHRFEFDRVPASIRVRLLGPFAEADSHRGASPKWGDQSTRVAISQSFLRVGLDEGAAAVIRWVQAARVQQATNFMEAFEFDPKPFSSDRTNHDAQLARQWQVTPAEERAVTGWDPAMDAYFTTVGKTPHLQDMLLKVISLPSAWSVVKNLGVKVEFNFAEEAVQQLTNLDWSLPTNAPTFSLPSHLVINKHPTLDVTLLVTAPRPPLLVCGGVVGFLAENPADEANYLTLRMLSAQRPGP